MSEEALAQRHNKRPAGIRKIENLLDRLKANKAGKCVNGREIPKPYEPLAKRVTGRDVLEKTKSQLPGVPDEISLNTARESTLQTLIKQGTVAGNKTLFVNSRSGLGNQASTLNASPTKLGSTMLTTSPSTGHIGYISLKAN